MMKEYENEFAHFIYYTPGDLDRQGQLWPVRAGRNLAKPHYQVGPKRIECFSLHFIHSGRLALNYGDEAIQLQSGDLFCLYPNRTYFYEMLASEQTLRMSWLALDGDRVLMLLELAGLTPDKPYNRGTFTPNVNKTVERTIHVLDNLERWSPAAAMELQGLISTMFAELLSDTPRAKAAETVNWLNNCLAYMELHATEGITVQQVAECAGLHRSYFTNTFTNHVGISPMKYLQKIRMDKAKWLLKNTSASVTEIAYTLGYSSLYSFTRAFKTYYNVAPLALFSSRPGDETS